MSGLVRLVCLRAELEKWSRGSVCPLHVIAYYVDMKSLDGIACHAATATDRFPEALRAHGFHGAIDSVQD